MGPWKQTWDFAILCSGKGIGVWWFQYYSIFLNVTQNSLCNIQNWRTVNFHMQEIFAKRLFAKMEDNIHVQENFAIFTKFANISCARIFPVLQYIQYTDFTCPHVPFQGPSLLMYYHLGSPTSLSLITVLSQVILDVIRIHKLKNRMIGIFCL